MVDLVTDLTAVAKIVRRSGVFARLDLSTHSEHWGLKRRVASACDECLRRRRSVRQSERLGLYNMHGLYLVPAVFCMYHPNVSTRAGYQVPVTQHRRLSL